MRSMLFLFTLVCIGSLLTSAAQAQQDMAAAVEYHVAVADPAQEEFDVTASLKGVRADTIVFHFPIWAPGAYDIVNFGAYVTDFTAVSDDGRSLQVQRGDTNTFTIIGHSKNLRLHYRVHDIETIRSSMWFCISDIGADYAFAVGAALYGYPAGYKDVPYSVSFAAPKGWNVAVSLDSTTDRYVARDYDELIDAPVQMGMFKRRDIIVNGKVHTITLTTFGVPDSVDINTIVAATEKVVKLTSDFFGEMPYNRYLFQYYLENPMAGVMRSIHGALEHRNSSTYLLTWMPGINLSSSIIPVIAHEYWHLWSPKRIHVRELGPFDYQNPPHTTSLWFAEGLTEYYARVLLSRSGINTSVAFMREAERDMKDIYGQEQPTPIAELSYNISQESPMRAAALYSTGPLIGLLMDAAIRTQTGNTRSLDDAMRFFNENYGRKGISFSDNEIIPIIERATGARLADFYSRYIAGHEPLPFDKYLPKIGLRYDVVQESKKGLGAIIESVPNGWLVTSVIPGGTADSMGLKPNDVITHMLFDGREPSETSRLPVDIADVFVSARNFQGLAVLRGEEKLTVSGPVLASIVPVRHLKLDEGATGQTLAIRQSMLGF